MSAGPEPDASGYKGFFCHFLDIETGRRVWQCELSTIDSAFLFGAGSHSSGVRRPLHSRPSAPTTPLSGTSTTAANGCMRANRACPNERFRCHRGMHALVRAMPRLFR
jgi:hypothetical protein